MTYTELEAAVKSWLNRNNFAALEAEIPLFFSLAQDRIDRHPDFFLIEAQEPVTLNTWLPSVPADFSKAVSMTIPSRDGHIVRFAAVQEVEAKRTSNPGCPELVTPIGSEFRFGPDPDQAYDISFIYQKTLEPISPSVSNNELSDSHPMLILHAVLVEACLWLKDDARASVWEDKFQQTMRSVHAHEINRSYAPGSIVPTTTYTHGIESVRVN
tara:strand:+ start:747 stop:1385 length:639 start_codon:yes stop_codon:yes gene_type:complete